MFSKFHFSRMFQRVTGVSPGRFLAAIRLEEAKRLLTSTDLNVADIGMRVGYSSVGTFSTRFTRSVGLSPKSYRHLGGYAPRIAAGGPFPGTGAAVCGQVLPAPAPTSPLVFLGLFPQRVPEGQPVRCAVLREPGPYAFTNVPSGSWYLLAHAVGGERDAGAQRWVTVAAEGPIVVRPESVATVDVHLGPAFRPEPPMLLALPGVRTTALKRISVREGALAA